MMNRFTLCKIPVYPFFVSLIIEFLHQPADLHFGFRQPAYFRVRNLQTFRGKGQSAGAASRHGSRFSQIHRGCNGLSGFLGLLLAAINYIRFMKNNGRSGLQAYATPALMQSYVILMLCTLIIAGAFIGA